MPSPMRCPHFTDGKTDAQRAEVRCPGLHIQTGWGWDCNSGLWLPLSHDTALLPRILHVLSLPHSQHALYSPRRLPLPHTPSFLIECKSSCETLAPSTCLLYDLMAFNNQSWIQIPVVFTDSGTDCCCFHEFLFPGVAEGSVYLNRMSC